MLNRSLTIGALLMLVACAPEETYDWHISGGQIIDGSGEAPQSADILIRDDKIAYIGDVDADELDIQNHYDASGYYVTPGFVDPHAHGNPLETPEFENFLAMGVTTILLGQDGRSPAPAELAERFDEIDQQSPSVNVAYLTGHNTIRRDSGVEHDDPDDEGLQRMVDMVEEAIEAGAFGLSLGLEYNYGEHSEMEELVAIAGPVADHDGIIISHMRSEDYDKIEDSIEELIEQGRQSGASVQASHLKIVLGDDLNQADRILQMMDDARADGVEVSADVYPYNASFTGISIVFPEWARPPNDYDEVVEERRDELAEYLRNRVNDRNGPGATLFGTGDVAGKTLEEVAEEEGQPFEEVLIDMGPGSESAAYFVMDEEVMKKFIADEHTVISSDGSPTMRHPRGYGAFAKVINEYTSTDGFLGLTETIRKMSGQTASNIGLDDPEKVDVPRGYLKEGFAADILVFDPEDVVDVADFENPHELAEGMQRIWVNGRPAWESDAPAATEGFGRTLRNQIAR